MAKRKAQRTAKPRSATKTRSKVKRTKPTAPNTRAKSKQDAVLALLSRPQGATLAAMIEAPFGARLSGRRGAQEAWADAGLGEDGGRAGLSRDRPAGGLSMLQRLVDAAAVEAEIARVR